MSKELIAGFIIILILGCVLAAYSVALQHKTNELDALQNKYDTRESYQGEKFLLVWYHDDTYVYQTREFSIPNYKLNELFYILSDFELRYKNYSIEEKVTMEINNGRRNDNN